MNALIRLFQELEKAHFFGTLEFKFEGGKVVFARQTQTLKPEDFALWREDGGSLWSQLQKNRAN